MAAFNKIADGFTLGVTPPITSGIEDFIYVYNVDDFVETYDPTNPLICTGLTPTVNGNKIFKFTGTNNSFGTSSTVTRTAVGPRYTEKIEWNIAGNSVAVKQMQMAAGYGRLRAIAINNSKSDDSTVELFGAECGLISSVAAKASSDESVEGGWKLELSQPDKLREPYPPRSVQIAGVSGPATWVTTKAALDLLTFTNV